MCEISYREQRQTQNGASEVEVMAGTSFQSPVHSRHQLEGFGNMRQHDHH